MKVPAWVKFIAILMVFKGGCGIMQNVGNINSPKMLEFQEELIDEISDEIEEDIEEERERDLDEEEEETISNENEEASEEVENIEEDVVERDSEESEDEGEEEEDDDDDEIETIKEMLTFSDYFKKWTVRFGYIGLVVSFISIVAGIFLFFPKQFTLKLLYFSLGLSIVVAIAQYIIMSNDDGSGVITMFSGIGSIMVGVFNVIILLIVIANDKTVFYPMEDDY